MITIGKIKYREGTATARLETNIKTDSKRDFLLFFEVEKEWAKYLVTDRADAFLVGILNKTMLTRHDIRCEDPVSSELKLMLERQLIHTLAKHDEKFYTSKIYADLTDEPLINAGAVGTGISLGLDSFTTIAENHTAESRQARLTHLLTFKNLVGGFYKKANWDYCAEKIYEKEKKVASELKLPLIAVNTNLPKFMHPRVDYYDTYMLIMAVMCLGKLFRAYYISSAGLDFSCFTVLNTYLKECATYDLLTIYCCTLQGGIKFISGGGEKDRIEKFQVIAKFPVARKNLLSCLTQSYNCMKCQKCKRNLVSLDALGLLDEFSEAYDITYYRSHRDEYIEWMCWQMQLQSHASEYIKPAYNMILQREPNLIEKNTYTIDKIFSQINELKRERNIYRRYTKLYRQLFTLQSKIKKLKVWFQLKLKKITSRIRRPAYISIGCKDAMLKNHAASMNKIFSIRNQLKHQRDIYREYAKLYRQLYAKQNREQKLEAWLQQRNIREVILYGNDPGTLFLTAIADQLGIKIPYVIEDLPAGRGIKRKIPKLPENTINYPQCDAIIICNVDKPWAIEKKLKEYVKVPVIKINDVLEMK